MNETKIDSRVEMVKKIYAEERQHQRRAQECWVEIGRILRDMKNELGREPFEQMVSEHMPFGRRQADKYIQIASYPEVLDLAKSINECCQEIANLPGRREGWLSLPTTQGDEGNPSSINLHGTVSERTKSLMHHHEATKEPYCKCAKFFGFSDEKEAGYARKVIALNDEELLGFLDSDLVYPHTIVKASKNDAAREQLRQTIERRRRKKMEKPTASQGLLDVIDGIRSLIDGWMQMYPDGFSRLRGRAEEIRLHGSVAQQKSSQFFSRVLAEVKDDVILHRQSDGELPE